MSIKERRRKPMRGRSMLVIFGAIVLISFVWGSADAGSKEATKVDAATEVLTEIMSIPEKGIPPSLLHNAYGIAVIPSVIKASLVVGGRYGTGILVVRSKEGVWSNPCFVSLAGGSVGYQIGAQSTDVILVFKSSKSIDGIIRGKFTLGADAAIAAGPVGRQAAAATDIQLKAEIYSYSRSRGLFAGVAVEGAALQIDHKSNEAFYGKASITPREIFTDKAIKVPAAANEFNKALAKYTAPPAKD
jgi:lipid-binding SYLF domain-containing protein